MSRIVYTTRERKFTYRKKRRYKNVLVWAGILFFGVGAIYALRMPFWQVKKLEIEAGDKVSKEMILSSVEDLLSGSYGKLVPRSLVFFVNVSTIQEKLKKDFLLIEDVMVVKKFPDTLTISVKERTFFGIFCNNPLFFKKNEGVEDTLKSEQTQCAYIDTNGFAYEEAPSSTGSLIIQIQQNKSSFIVPSQAIPQDVFKKVVALRDLLPSRIGENAVLFEFREDSPREFRVKTSRGYMLWLNKSDDLESVLKILKTVLDKEIKERRANILYIDLRFGNKVFYKWQ